MRIRKRARYDLIEFIRPINLWPHPYTLEQAFGVYRWMVEKADDYPDPRHYGRNALANILSCSSALPAGISPITSIDDLKERFQWALLVKSERADIWRFDHNISVYSSLWVSFPHYEPFTAQHAEAHYRSCLRSLFSDRGRLTTQLNKCHADAVDIYGVGVHIRQPHTASGFIGGWSIVLSYGVDRSSWTYTLAKEEFIGEPFYDILLRANTRLAELKGEA